MHNVAATIGLQQLQSIDALLERHVSNGQYYDFHLDRIPGLKPARVLADAKPTYWLYTLLAEDSDDVERKLAAIGITAAKLHRPNHYHSIFEPHRWVLPGLEAFYRRLIHIPCGWWVTEEDRSRIVDTLAKG
jgi:dTDP-4-amino-4,6-dideoxygalactose transaminase